MCYDDSHTDDVWRLVFAGFHPRPVPLNLIRGHARPAADSELGTTPSYQGSAIYELTFYA